MCYKKLPRRVDAEEKFEPSHEGRCSNMIWHKTAKKEMLLRYRESNPGLLGSLLRASDVSHYTIPDVVVEELFLIDV